MRVRHLDRYSNLRHFAQEKELKRKGVEDTVTELTEKDQEI